MKKLCRLIFMLPLISMPVVGQAQIHTQDNIPTDDNPWYEVSVVIFKQPKHLMQSEQWKAGDELSLSLPRHLLSLEEATEDDTAKQSKKTEPTTSTEIQTLDENTTTAEVELPTAFLTQAPSDEEFLSTINRLNRSKNYDILYQKTWLQPGLDEKEALPVLIQAGEVYDGLYELEGTATLHVARYLHFNSELWLSKYVQHLEVIKPWWQDSEPDTEVTPISDGFGENDFTIQLGGKESTSEDNDQSISLAPSFNQMGSTMSMDETITRYKSVRTGVMNESRRMRSGELHYIDHPLFGIVVKVTPYELPKEENETPEADGTTLTQ